MRELHAAWHENGGRHRRGHDAIAPADIRLARAQDSPQPEARDSLKLTMLLDPEARKAERLKYQQKVEAAEAAYAARHARPGTGDQRQAAPEQPRPQQAKPDHAPAEPRDKPVSRIDERTKPLDDQHADRRIPERSRLPKNDTAQMLGGYGIAIASVADAVNILPGRWDAVVAGFIGAAVATVAWANRRWKEQHGHRPED
jgi:hypothetical protein